MNPNALIKLGTNALTNVGTNALTQAGTSALSNLAREATTKALTNSLTRRLTGAGISTLAKGAGSTLDGILGRSSGLILPEPKITPITLAESAEKVFPGENIKTIGDMITKFEGSNLDKIYKNKGLSKKSYDALREGAREAAEIGNSALDAVGLTSKSQLRILSRIA